jgi:hypothetical protein
MKAYLFAAAAALALAGAPASARVLKFTITNVGGTDRGDFSFTLDEDRAPDVVLADQVRYGTGAPGASPRIAITYADVPGVGSGVTSSGVSFFAPVQQGGLALTGPAGVLRLLNTQLITNTRFTPGLPKAQNKAIFKLGVFALSTTAQNSSPVRPFDNYRVTIAAIPEPATWAMMLAGFAAVGAAARRRSGQPLAQA